MFLKLQDEQKQPLNATFDEVLAEVSNVKNNTQQDCLLQCQAQLKQKVVFRFFFIMLKPNPNLNPTH